MLYAALVCLVLAVVTSIMLYSDLSTGRWGLGLLFPLFFALYAVTFLLGLRRAERRNRRGDGRE